MSLKSKVLLYLFLAMGGLLSTSCDKPLRDFRGANFIWSDDASRPITEYMNSFCLEHNGMYWVVGIWEGRQQLGGQRDLVLLCIHAGNGNWALEQGIAIRVWEGGKAQLREIARLRVLQENYVRIKVAGYCDLTCKYSGPVIGKSTRDDGKDMRWLRLEIQPKRDEQKVKAIMEEVRALLEKEPHAMSLMACMRPIFEQ